MNTQEAYETMREYFSRPGAVLAKSEDDGCRYRAGENACAVGCLIPDELYDQFWRDDIDTTLSDDPALGHDEDGEEVEANRLEGQTLGGLLNYLKDDPSDTAAKLYAILDDDPDKVRFLRAAQMIHDNVATDAGKFVLALDALALSRGLTTGWQVSL